MLQIKRGDTFAFFADINDESGNPMVTEVSNLRCQVRDSVDKLYDIMTVAATETPGKYLFTAGDDRVMGGFVTVTLKDLNEVAVGVDYYTNLNPVMG